MIDASQRMIGKEKHNPIVNNHLELIIIIKTPQNAPRDAEKLEALLKSKERERKEIMHT
ncbi:MAG TPA: hypothetical protein VE572_03825 [Nitrososphaeraceae archaeon]|nr:hypothetical protein [Nitrososphaeraceae archaeon]